MVHPRLATERKTAVPFHRQVIAGRREIKVSGADRLLVGRLLDRHRQAMGKNLGQAALTLLGQMQHGNDRQAETVRQFTEYRQQRLDAACRSAHSDGFQTLLLIEFRSLLVHSLR